ncbi:hypothetical protein CN230_29895 [Sinorhizobium meliloti]|uniref:family 16 glycoside hydrolase n=1 Tax=Rhizobium meliloti TaxID=382 RepID=UPI000FD7D7C4|nr:family 16 glycoside hydrolase [Sinorhizobium meliloti]RVG03259.1 hypothetical protein CN230_29895 [Sinorhizobium meliloti]
MAPHFLIVSTFAAVTLMGSASAETISFGLADPGTLPKDFASALTGNGSPGRWEVVEDASAEGGRALAQLSQDTTADRYPLAIYMPALPSELEARVRFKAVSGSVDQAGGVAVRLQSAQNYYLARANALEDNVRFYAVKGGRREQLAGANLEVTAGEWHTLAVRAQGNRFVVLFDGAAVIETQDETFLAPGKIALWTKADSVTRFDRIEIVLLGETEKEP